MSTTVLLKDLGPRICIIGPSNSGKSTLAYAISCKTALPVVHLDQLHHHLGSNWKPRNRAEFLNLHAEAISQDKWVMDGNYIKCIEERLARSTGLILLDVPITIGLLRYIRRCYSSSPRIGGLRTGREHVTWEMIKYITLVAPKNRLCHKKLYEQARLPKLLLKSPQEVKTYFKLWDLQA
ncbi:AAA family ATPase [Enterobacteriaceae bacterium H11S18]|uniref:AAA family ATPase n=1 Tax=Dryocola clanedunensis TaxID=2925396 RepID=UPI0022F0F68F|nr:AAA family ATPase [Dryocola clanedunensis]MCT4709094.1 AAA family ATPase [Dryocola clanedunensis]